MNTIATACLTPSDWIAYDEDADVLIVGYGHTWAEAVADFLSRVGGEL